MRAANLTEQNGRDSGSLCAQCTIFPNGTALFDGAAAETDSLYQTAYIVTDSRGAYIILDYLIQTYTYTGQSEPYVVEESSNPLLPQTTVYSRPYYYGADGQPMEWYLVADDLLLDQPVIITAFTLPAGATTSQQMNCSDSVCSCTNGQCKDPQVRCLVTRCAVV